MLNIITEQIKVALRVVIFFSLLTGIIYPFAMTGLAQLFFPWRSNGSMIVHQRKPIASLLIGQYFTDEKYFWGRPSATSRFPYDAENSSGSNLAFENQSLLNIVKARVDHLKLNNPEQGGALPMDLVTASASGLDPDISPRGALYQVPRIAKARNISEKTVTDLIQQSILPRTFRIFGEPRVNVFLLNMSLDHLNSNVE
ncbi:MAG: potassium-transporting ATPase subunit KdpC [Gammaproteobacteria bacterium]|nr:potassium-transporting ATPase subunit KdpC [Gammaproteobacteria bacterium]